MFTRSLWEKKSISFYYLLGKDLFFCLKKLALFWLPPRSERTIIQRNGRRSNHDTSVARQRIRVKNPVLQSSVYRAPLEGIVTFSRRIRVISSPSLSPNLSIISNEFVHRPHRNRCFRFRFDPAAIQALEFGINLWAEIQFDSKWGEGIIYRRDRIALPFVTNRAAARELTLQLAVFRGNGGIDGAITWNGRTVAAVWAIGPLDFASCKSWKSRPFAAINWEFRFFPVRNKNWLLIHRQQFLTSFVEEERTLGIRVEFASFLLFFFFFSRGNSSRWFFVEYCTVE